MSKKYTIQVRRYQRDEYGSRTTHEVIDTIKRTLRAECIGNFNPLFCTYKGNNRCLVDSDKGDLSDPFRREDNYAECLYIEPKPLEETEG